MLFIHQFSTFKIDSKILKVIKLSIIIIYLLLKISTTCYDELTTTYSILLKFHLKICKYYVY